MSFELICDLCGAVSGPSVGVCPFCKGILSRADQVDGESSLQKYYAEGSLEMALNIAQKIYRENPKSKKDAAFILIYVKILIESEGPASLINALLTEGLILEPENPVFKDYIEIMQAKTNLKSGLNDPGEITLKNVLRRSPDNVHALFLLGSHLHWVDKADTQAVFYLEKCANLSPNFLRAWGCLSVVYKALGNLPLCMRALRRCLELEKNSTMKDFFQKELNKISM